MEVQIEKNIPMRKATVWPFPEMEVGDSFLAPLNKENSVRRMGCYYQEKLGWTFTGRRQEDGYRIWRTT